MEATRAHQIECVRLLLDHKADVHARSDRGQTALNFSTSFSRSCVERNETACTRLLLEAGADVNAADHDGYTTLMHAALYGKRSLGPLLEAGADVHAANANGFTPMLSACRSGYMENVLLLDGLGADPHAVSNDGNTALMLACSRGHGDIVQWLINKNINLDEVQQDGQYGGAGRTALIISYGDQRRMLIEAGADLNVTDTQGWTALMHACNEGNINATQELIAAGAYLCESSGDNCAINLAVEGKHWPCVNAMTQAYEKLQNGRK
jgi:ankyrin repeat protein